MKKILKITVVFCLAICLVLCLSGCNLFATMRENAEKAAMTTLADTPEDNDAFEKLNNSIDSAFDNAEKITESISYKVGGVSVTKDGEKAGLLNDGASLLKGLIMNGKPGKSDREITDRNDAGLLGSISSDSAVDFEITRNKESEIVTDENGKDVTNENGEVETVLVDADNLLNYVLKYYSTEKTVDEEGNEKEEYTITDAAAIEAVFGQPADKDAVLEQFASAKDYITVGDYEITYGRCEIKAVVDLENGEISSVEFVSRMNVSAKAVGNGSLSSYGDITVEFELTKTTSYGFTYVITEE